MDDCLDFSDTFCKSIAFPLDHNLSQYICEYN